MIELFSCACVCAAHAVIYLCELTLLTHLACQTHPERCPLKQNCKHCAPTYVQMFIRPQLLHTINSPLSPNTLCIVSGCHWKTSFYCLVYHCTKANEPCKAVTKTCLKWSSFIIVMTWLNRIGCPCFHWDSLYLVQTTLVYAGGIISRAEIFRLFTICTF